MARLTRAKLRAAACVPRGLVIRMRAERHKPSVPDERPPLDFPPAFVRFLLPLAVSLTAKVSYFPLALVIVVAP